MTEHSTSAMIVTPWAPKAYPYPLSYLRSLLAWAKVRCRDHCLFVSERFGHIQAKLQRHSSMEPHKLSNRPIAFNGRFDRMNSDYDISNTCHFIMVKTCNQIYDEAILIPYQKTTFSFDDNRVLDRFLMAHTPVSCTVELVQIKRRAIRSLQLQAI